MVLTKSDLQEIDKLLGKRLRKGLVEQRKAINQDIGEFISRNVIPQVDEISETVDRIERRLETHQDRLDGQGKRIENLEKIHPQGKHPATV